MEKNAQMAKVEDNFTAKEEKFCYESISSTLLTKVNIQKRIKEKQDKLAETAGLKALKVVTHQ